MRVRELKPTQSDGVSREFEERLRITFERAPVGIAHLDSRGRWQLVNEQLCALLGYDREGLLARRFETLLDIDLRRDSQPVSRGGSARIERRYVRKGGDVTWLRVAVSQVSDDDGRLKYYVAIVEDVSATKASDGALGIAAHELRLPLSHIKGFLSTLRRADVDWDASTRREFLSEAEREADRLESLIHDLLDQSAGAPAISPRRSSIHPCALVVTTVTRLRPMIGDREVRISVPTTLPPLQVEVTAIERVLANLLLNANKYSPRSEPIDVAGRLVGDMLEVQVADRGPGVPAQDAERIFEPFYRREVHAGDDGHGLGLAICRSIVTSHGGRIWVAPRAGGGASFTMALPVTNHTATRRPGRKAVAACATQSSHRWPRTPGARPVQTVT